VKACRPMIVRRMRRLYTYTGINKNYIKDKYLAGTNQ